MRVSVINSNNLYSFFSSVLPYNRFSLFMHIITDPYVSLLASLPAPVKKRSEVYLDGEKREFNAYVVGRLRESGYERVYYVDKLHGKVAVIGDPVKYLVVGTSNLTRRSFANFEAVVVIEDPDARIIGDLDKYFVRHVKEAARPAW